MFNMITIIILRNWIFETVYQLLDIGLNCQIFICYKLLSSIKLVDNGNGKQFTLFAIMMMILLKVIMPIIHMTIIVTIIHMIMIVKVDIVNPSRFELLITTSQCHWYLPDLKCWSHFESSVPVLMQCWTVCCSKASNLGSVCSHKCHFSVSTSSTSILSAWYRLGY